MPFSSLSTTPGFNYDPASPASPSSTFKEIYTVQVPGNAHSPPQSEGERQEQPGANLGMTYSVYRYNPQIYSSYSTLKGWDGDNVSRGGSFEARGPAFTFPVSRTLRGPTAFPDEWNESSSTNASTSNPSTSSQISTSPYPIDSTFGWYDSVGENNCRPLNSLRGLQDYSAGLNDIFSTEPPHATGAETNEDTDNYIFSFSNPPL
jgi:hypothetical protein